MRGANRALEVANRALRPVNLRVAPIRSTCWDRLFLRWVSQAKAKGVDPNDVGDADWDDDRLQLGLDEWYLDGIDEEATVVELGPGSGRLTRHLIGRCRHLELLDFSPVVCNWLKEYLAGKGSFDVHQIHQPRTGLASGSVDAVVAHGVVEHLDQETLFEFLTEFARILRKGGTFTFSFDNLASDFARTHLSEHTDQFAPGRFRFYQPEGITRLGEMTGYTPRVFHDRDRIAFAELTRN